LVAVLNGSLDFIDVRKINLRINALTEQVQTKSHKIHVSGALTVTEQAAFDAVCPSHVPLLGGRDCSATVIVWVKREQN
jgi:hypothetical protein